jgi:hypothetical protein
MADKKGSSGQHRDKTGKTRFFGANKSDRVRAEREKQARIARERGQRQGKKGAGKGKGKDGKKGGNDNGNGLVGEHGAY